jgi:hypothetical protein
VILPKKELGMKRTYTYFAFIMAVFSILAISGCSEKKEAGNKNSAVSDAKSETGKILWKDIEIDMSFDDVKKLYPTIELFSKANEEIKADIYRLDDGIVIQKENFFVQFAFIDDKIIEVFLFPERELYSNTSDKLFDGLKEELTEKYGNPFDQDSGRINLLYNYERIIWNVQGVIIILHYEEARFSTDISTLYLYYQPGEIKKEDNL